jgi:competence protein ComEA
MPLPFDALPVDPRPRASSPVASAAMDRPFLADALDLPAGSRLRGRARSPGRTRSSDGSRPPERSRAPGREPAAADLSTSEPPGPRLALGGLDQARRGMRALVVVTVVVVAIAALLMWYARPKAEVVDGRVDLPPAEEVASGTGTLVVAVTGRVMHPGLVRLPAGARVADAIEAAGGALPGTDLSYINLARKVTDGELITIGVTVAPGAPGGAADAAGGLINLNTATLAQLDTLPGVGPVLAQRILDYRTRHGSFRSVSELRQVDGVGDARYEQLRHLVTV